MKNSEASRCPVCGKNHHALCHKCPHAEEVAAGRYAEAEFHKTPCFGCRHAKNDRQRHVRGCDVVSFEEVEGFEAMTQADEDDMTRLMKMLSFTLGQILGIHDSITRECVIRRMRGESLADISAEVTTIYRKPLSFQAVHERIEVAVRENRNIGYLLSTVRKTKGSES